MNLISSNISKLKAVLNTLNLNDSNTGRTIILIIYSTFSNRAVGWLEGFELKKRLKY
jgi:hypothetical protein